MKIPEKRGVLMILEDFRTGASIEGTKESACWAMSEVSGMKTEELGANKSTIWVILKISVIWVVCWELSWTSQDDTGKPRLGNGSTNLSEVTTVWKGKISSWKMTSLDTNIYLDLMSYEGG